MDYQDILAALAQAAVRFVVVGGYAVVLHGVPRFTRDLDLLVDLDRDNLEKLLSALERLGLESRPPVPADQLLSERHRRRWIEEKGLRAFSFWHPEHPYLVVDVLLVCPVSFEDAFEESVEVSWQEQTARIAGIEHLIAMKRRAGRKQDVSDVEALEKVLELREEERRDHGG